jgi:diguanylate cyclase (GGDEF)-like protein
MNLFNKSKNAIDFKSLNSNILNISSCQDIDSIVSSLSICLNEILDCELLSLVVKHNESIDVWLDSRVSDETFRERAKKDFDFQNINYDIRHFNNRISEKRYPPVRFHAGDTLCFKVIPADQTTMLYIQPRKNMLHEHNEALDIIIKTTGIAVENSMIIKRLGKEAVIDSLTQCYNRRALYNFLEHDIANTARYGESLSAIMLDIDHFKKINDVHGHQAGDKVLKQISKIMLTTIRKSDYVVRYGGEEFLQILPNTNLLSALNTAERLRKKINNHNITINNKTVNVTASFGVAEWKNDFDKYSFLQKADEMLYKAKFSGRNNVMPDLTLFSMMEPDHNGVTAILK